MESGLSVRCRPTTARWLALGLVLLQGTASADSGVIVLTRDTGGARSLVISALERSSPSPVAIHDLEGDAPRALRARLEGLPDPVLVALGEDGLEAARTLAPETPRVFALVDLPDCKLPPRPHETGVVLRVDATRMAQTLAQVLRLEGDRPRSVGIVRSRGALECSVQELRGALDENGILLQERFADGIRAGVHELRVLSGTSDAIVLFPDPDVLARESIEIALRLGFDRGIPVVGFSRSVAAGGGLFALGIDPEAIGRQVARLVEKIRLGTSPASLPPERPDLSVLVLNDRASRILGIPFPDALRAEAADVLHER